MPATLRMPLIKVDDPRGDIGQPARRRMRWRLTAVAVTISRPLRKLHLTIPKHGTGRPIQSSLLASCRIVCIDAEAEAFDHSVLCRSMARCESLRKHVTQHCPVGRGHKVRDASWFQFIEPVVLNARRAPGIPCQPTPDNPCSHAVHFVDWVLLGIASRVLDRDDAHRANLHCVGTMRFAGASEIDLLAKVLGGDSRDHVRRCLPPGVVTKAVH